MPLDVKHKHEAMQLPQRCWLSSAPAARFVGQVKLSTQVHVGDGQSQ